MKKIKKNYYCQYRDPKLSTYLVNLQEILHPNVEIFKKKLPNPLLWMYIKKQIVVSLNNLSSPGTHTYLYHVFGLIMKCLNLLHRF